MHSSEEVHRLPTVHGRETCSGFHAPTAQHGKGVPRARAVARADSGAQTLAAPHAGTPSADVPRHPGPASQRQEAKKVLFPEVIRNQRVVGEPKDERTV